MENSDLTKSQRKEEINDIFYINLWQKEEHRSNEGNCASTRKVILKLVFPHLQKWDQGVFLDSQGEIPH